MNIGNLLNTILVSFVREHNQTEKTYAFLTKIPDLTVGDIVVVETVNGIALGKVIQIGGLAPAEREKATKFAFQKVDLEILKQLNKTQAELNEIKHRLDQARQRFDERSIYIEIAKTDPAIAQMLARMDELLDSHNLPTNMLEAKNVDEVRCVEEAQCVKGAR